MEQHKKFSPWIYISLTNDEFSDIRAWLHRVPRAQSSDKNLAIKCEIIIDSAFKRNDLKYFSKGSENIAIEEMIISLVKEGMFIPEEFFIDPPDNLKRVENPYQNSTDEA